MESEIIDLVNYNETDFEPQLCTNYYERMSIDKASPMVYKLSKSSDLMEETSPQQLVLPSSLRQLMDCRNSNTENRSSAGQFSIGSNRISDLRLSLPKEERVSNPFEKTVQHTDNPTKANDFHPTIKGCNCKKTQCLRGYCECFVRGKMCSSDCNCMDCRNTQENIEEVNDARKRIRIKYASRFHPGCNCQKTLCLRNYCSCFRNGGQCGKECRCVGCENRNGTVSSEQKTDITEGKKLFDVESNISL